MLILTFADKLSILQNSNIAYYTIEYNSIVNFEEMTTVNEETAENIATAYMSQKEHELDFNAQDYFPFTLDINGKYLMNFDTLALFNVNTKKEVRVCINDVPVRVNIKPSPSTIVHIINTFIDPYYGHDHNIIFTEYDSDDDDDDDSGDISDSDSSTSADSKITFNIDFPFTAVYNAIFNYVYERTRFEQRLHHHFRRL